MFNIVKLRTDSFKERRLRILKNSLLVSTVFAIVVGFTSGWFNGALISLFVFVIQYVKSMNSAYYFLESFQLLNKKINIIYLNKEKRIEVIGDISDFKIKRKFAFSRNREPYILIYFKKTLLLRQDAIDSWTERDFDLLVKVFNDI